MRGKKEIKNRLILALDPDLEKIKELLKKESVGRVTLQTGEELLSILDELEGKVGFVKINYSGLMVPWILDELKKRKINIWLDWKWKDIPRTVEGFVIGAVMRGVSMITIHSDGGLEMIKYATEAVNIAKEMNGSSRPKVLAVSVLTSINDKILNEELDISGEVVDRVRHYAFLAQEGGVDGIVASAREAPVLRRDLDPKMLIVTPGIKPKWAAKNVDQKRITTPYEAIKNGSTHLVVGSAIIKAEKYGKTRAEAAEDIIAEIQKAMDEE